MLKALLVVVLAVPCLAQQRASWLRDEPLVIVGNWDTAPIFERRRGGEPVWQEEEYRKEHSEEAVRRLKDLGVTMAVIHFYKGFGLEAEKEQLQDSIRLAALCHKHGLRAGVYVGSTLGYETFLVEKPDAASWIVPRYLGRPIYYGDQTFRKRVYFMHPGYREYIKRVLKVAVEQVKADLIHFDNTSLQAQPEIFLHPMAVEDFRKWLAAKYTPEQRKLRFGFADVRYMEPPELGGTVRAINDPLWQEWADFRCHQLAAYYEEMGRYIRGLNPEVAVENNPHLGISGHNTVWEEGVDYPRLLAPLDVMWTEEGNDAGISPAGILVSKIRTYKMAATLKNRIFTYTGGTRGGKVAMAEAMTYNRMTLGMVGGMSAPDQLAADQKRYVRFYLDHFENYKGVESRADVAVLHSYASMAYSNDEPWLSAMLLEQTLIQAKVPFDIVFDANLKDLSKYRVLALAGQECLSDAQAQMIRGFVKRGGGLVATGASSLYTEWRKRRADFALQDLFQVNAPRFRPEAEESAEPTMARMSEVGGGRVAYIPAIRPAIAKPAGAAAASQYWKLPLNWQELANGVKWAAGGSLSLTVNAPQTVTAEVVGQNGGSKLLVHLINYAAASEPQVRNVGVSLAAPAGKRLREVALISPDREQAKVEARMAGGRVEFTVPELDTYTVALVNFE